MNKIISLFLLTFIFGQNIVHEIPESIPSEIPYKIDVFIDIKPEEVYSFFLMYRFSHQETFFESKMLPVGVGNYTAEIPGNLIVEGKLEYFLVLELSENRGFVSFPQLEPMINPIKVKIKSDVASNVSNFELNDSNLQSPITILSPQPHSKIMKDDLLIAVSYFALNNIDTTSIQLFLDKKNVTSQSTIRGSHLIFNPQTIFPGKHAITIKMKNIYGLEFEPIMWEFTLITQEEQQKFDKDISYSGRVWTDYSQNFVDTLNVKYNTINYDVRAKMDWIKFRYKIMISSLESEFEQPRNRYFADFNTPFLKLKLGDVYPDLGKYTIKGYRVRGLDFKFTTKYFQLNYVQGQLARAVQGDPLDDAIIISDVIDNTVTLSRDNYVFDQDINAVNFGFGNSNRFHWNMNVMKTKDNINSVEKAVDGAIIELTDGIEQLFSKVFLDSNSNGKYDDGEYNQNYYDNETEWWDLSIQNTQNPQFLNIEFIESDFISTQIIGIYCGEDGVCDEEENEYNEDTNPDPAQDNYDSVENLSGTEGLNLIQYFWNVSVSQENLEASLDSLDVDYTVEDLSNDQWDGNKPEDNIVLGSDFSMSFDNQKIKFKTGFAFSMLNQNIWDPVMTNADFDVLMDEYADCFIGQIYSNVPSDLVWENCQASSELNPNWLPEENIITEGTSLDDIPLDPADYENIFHMNINQVPLVPIDITTGEIGIGEILMMPSLAYNIDLSLNYLGHNLDFGFKQVGPEFNSLSNPYIQKDIREQSFSDRVRLLENRMFIFFKWKRTEDGILENNIGKTDRFDMNLSLYPGIDLPTFNIGFGSYIRDNGISESECYGPDGIYVECTDDILNGLNETDNFTIITRKESTKSNQFNISATNKFEFHGKHNVVFSLFSSEKIDLMMDENQGNEDYYSPRSKSNAVSINLKTIFNTHWELATYFGHSYYDYGAEDSEYFQKQYIDNFDFTVYYKTNTILKQLYSGLNFSTGSGTADYNQYGLKVGIRIEPFSKLVVRADYNFKHKTVTDENVEYDNSSLTGKIQYLF